MEKIEVVEAERPEEEDQDSAEVSESGQQDEHGPAEYPFPEGVTTSVHPNQVRWNMDWSKHKHESSPAQIKAKPDSEPQFEEEMALAMLIINDQVFVNSYWWEKEWPKEAQRKISLNVNCNDVFAWGCADGEDLEYADIEAVYGWWERNPKWGTAAWCCVKRREMPQRPVEKAMRQGGVDMDALQAEHNLRPNAYDGLSKVRSDYQYQLYAAWEREQGRQPVDKVCTDQVNWWDHWRRYQQANPKWHEEHDATIDAEMDNWLEASGFERRKPPEQPAAEVVPPAELSPEDGA